MTAGMDSIFWRLVSIAAVFAGVVDSASVAAKCSTTLTAQYPAPSVASGYVARLVANQLTNPRGIKFDTEGHLLVIEEYTQLTALTFDETDDGCIIENTDKRKTVVDNNSLNHGIELSQDGKTLYASSTNTAWSWDYDASTASTTSNSSDGKVIVTDMAGSDHSTRTLLLSRKDPGMFIVTRGSQTNIDLAAEELSSGYSQVKAFDLNSYTKPYVFNDDGVLLGWGLRNDVGIDEEPVKGRIFAVENSVDQIRRDGIEIHNSNPAEELNDLGLVSSAKPTSDNAAPNYGYPVCYTAWDLSTIKGFTGNVGQQFAVGNFSFNHTDGITDAVCMRRKAPRLPFHPHMAPLDILFNDAGSAGWVTFHGSWDSKIPVGYKVSVVPWANGEPLAPSTSKTALIDIVENHDTTTCDIPGDTPCFRPVGLAWDSKGRLFFSSDQTGEIYAIMRADGSSVMDTNPKPSSTTGSGSGSSSASMVSASSMTMMALILIVFAFFM